MKTLFSTVLALTMVLFASTAMAEYGTGSSSDSQSTSTAQQSNMGFNNGQDQGQGQGQQQGNYNISDSGNTSTVNGSDLSRMVPSVMAPALTTTLTETCMGSTSVGVGWSGAGFSFGTTWRDSACVRRLDARQISSIHPNFAIAAKELMCDSDAVFAAFKRAGLPCAPRDGYEVAVAEPKK